MSGYRLGLDIGTNSIGWCAVMLDSEGRSCGVKDAGVRILTPNDEAGRDPKSKASLAATRRSARGARRRRDRFVRRRERLMAVLIEAGLMPANLKERKALEKLDPYWLRREALDRRLELHEIGRALFHLNQRRGFKSNRLADADNDEKSAMKQGAEKLEAAIGQPGQPRTLGEYLANRHRRDRCGHREENGAAPESTRFRPTSQGTKNLYDFYPTRELIEAELDRIWTSQQRYHGDVLTKDLRDTIGNAILHQRDLKPQIVGRCTLRPEEEIVAPYGFGIDLGERAPKAHPLFQRFRVLQDVCQLRIVRPGMRERCLTLTERNAVAAALMQRSGNIVAFEALRKALKLPDEARFNYERSGRKGFPPNQTATKLGAKKTFGKVWRSLPRDRQIEVVERVLAVEDEADLCAWLRSGFGLDGETAERIADTRLPQGHGQFGRAALRELVAVMETESAEVADPETGEIYERPLTYDEAVDRIGRHHSDHRPERRASLPYYGEILARHVVSRPSAPEGSQERIGRVPNPTVHIGLNQLRRIVNALIETYGPPREIAVELARELKLNKKRKDDINKQNRENREANDKNREELAGLELADTHDNRLRLRLYDELPAAERVCVYSGTPISKRMLFGGGIEIDHILPHSKTLDDGFMNKVLCTRESNRRKGNRAPAQAWDGDERREIAERAERLFPKKAWRFAPDAMERFEEQGGIAARHLTDTQHMSRLAKTYLEHVCERVDASPGRLTAMLRGRWGLNDLLPDHNYANVNQPKNRKDHRNHAIDAFVLACTDLGLLNRIARESGRAEELDLDRLFPKDSFPVPFPGYREALGARLNTLVVSHKPDHCIPPGARDDVSVTSGALLEGSAFGEVDEVIDGKHYNLVTRVAVHKLTSNMIEGKRDYIVRDASLRHDLQEVLEEAGRQGRKLDEALFEFGEKRGIRRVRVLKTEKSVKVVEHNGFRKVYSAGDNHRIEIYELPDGEWRGEGVTVFDANQPGFEPEWHAKYPDAKLAMRVHNGDLIEADFGDGRLIYRVCRLEASNNRLRLAPHSEAGSLAERHSDPDDPFRYAIKSYSPLKAAEARRVRIDPIGRVAYAKERP